MLKIDIVKVGAHNLKFKLLEQPKSIARGNGDFFVNEVDFVILSSIAAPEASLKQKQGYIFLWVGGIVENQDDKDFMLEFITTDQRDRGLDRIQKTIDLYNEWLKGNGNEENN